MKYGIWLRLGTSDDDGIECEIGPLEPRRDE